MKTWKAGFAGKKMLKKNASQKGSALIYILIAIALLAALTATFMDSSSSQTSSQNAANTVSELASQINFIRSAIDECVLTYPGGDSNMPVDPVGGHNPVRPYPLSPTNTYLSSPSANSYVQDLGCPGNPGNSNNHVKIFGGNSGKFLPKPPNMFNNWFYYNHTDGVYIMTSTEKTDAYLDTALQKLDAQFSKCESQYINNTTGGAPVSTSSQGHPCNIGSKCFVVRIRTTATTIYPGETGCP